MNDAQFERLLDNNSMFVIMLRLANLYLCRLPDTGECGLHHFGPRKDAIRFSDKKKAAHVRNRYKLENTEIVGVFV